MFHEGSQWFKHLLENLLSVALERENDDVVSSFAVSPVCTGDDEAPITGLPVTIVTRFSLIVESAIVALVTLPLETIVESGIVALSLETGDLVTVDSLVDPVGMILVGFSGISDVSGSSVATCSSVTG